MNKKLICIALSMAALSGCASVVGKSQYAVAINSNPDNANFVITNRAGQSMQSGVTPTVVTLRSSSGYFKGETYTVTFNKEGFDSKSYSFTSGLSGWYFGNIMLGGLLGMVVVDPLTGAMFTLPDRVDVALDQKVASVKSDSLTIVTLDSLTPEQVSRLKRLQ